jgi:hypothetical protein
MMQFKRRDRALLEAILTTTQELVDLSTSANTKLDQLLAATPVAGIPAADQANIDTAGTTLTDMNAKLDAALAPPATTAATEPAPVDPAANPLEPGTGSISPNDPTP